MHVTCTASREEVIRYQKAYANIEHKMSYIDDEEALWDFKMVYWATEKDS